MLLTVDSSIWVSACITTERDHDLAHEFVMAVFGGKHQVVQPTTTITEVVCAIARRSRQIGLDSRIATEWGESIGRSSFISWRAIDRAFAREAAYCGRIHGLRGMDALIGATAVYYSIPLLAEDVEFDRLVPSVSVLRLKDVV